MNSENEAIAYLIERGLGRPSTRTYCLSCGNVPSTCKRSRCREPRVITQSRYVFETPWVTLDRQDASAGTGRDQS